MKNIEEQLWDYVDGTCTPQEQETISYLIATDEAYRQKYAELLSFTQEMANIELDEPPMAFTYNVMEAIRTEEASKPLKAAIDNRIIKGIAAFFILTIAALVAISLANTNWSAGESMQMPLNIHVPAVKNLFSGMALKGFLFFDVVLALFLFDGYLRKRNAQQQG